MSYRGDIRLGDTIDIKFCTVTTTGAPTQLAGSPAVAAYVGNGTTEITAGITLSVDFDGRTGLNNVRVVASGGNGFAAGTNVDLVITAGTVGGTSVVGYVVGSFSIEARSALMPTTAARTLDVSAAGEAGIDWANIGSPTTAQNLSATNIDVDQVVASVSGAVGSVAANGITAASIATDAIDADAIADNAINAGAIATGAITAAKFAAGAIDAAAIANGAIDAATFAAGAIDAAAIANGAIDAATFAAGAIDAAAIADNAIDAGAIAANAITAAKIATDAIGAAQLAADAVAEIQSGLATSAALATVQADTDNIQTRLPAALVSGRMDSSVGAMAADTVTASALAADAVAEIADGVWDEAIAGHLGAGSTGAALNAAGGSGDPWATALPGAYGAGTAGNIVGNNLDAPVSSRSTQSSVDTIDNFIDTEITDIQSRLPAALVGGRMDSSVGAMAANTLNASALAADAVTEIQSGLATSASIAALNNISAAQVNAEVVDVLSVDTYPEPGQGAPPATNSIASKLSYLFKGWRNRQTQDATEYNLYADDAVTVDQRADVSDDGTTFNRSEIASGP